MLWSVNNFEFIALKTARDTWFCPIDRRDPSYV